ncbi:RcpC/CpaB family pilus assembly protein [Brevibacillus ginsengisoli]|uniref:RcpC/CpaB family pilus assembly protein n=1 Tax=Brevibacillus ginsengisoli TaxID=363854 RepID=UPI003CEDE07B
MKLPAIHPVRAIGILLLAGTVALGSYQVWKPSTFTYIKLKEGVTVEGGSKLTEEVVEPATITTQEVWQTNRNPVSGFIAWSAREQAIGSTTTRRLIGGVPLLTNDLNREGEDELNSHLDKSMTGMSIPVDNIIGVTPYLSVGDRVHVYASFEDDQGAHSGLLLRSMPILSLQREAQSETPKLVGVTIGLRLEQAVLLTHALHYGKIRLGKASVDESLLPGIGDVAFANALMKTKKRWSSQEVEQ